MPDDDPYAKTRYPVAGPLDALDSILGPQDRMSRNAPFDQEVSLRVTSICPRSTAASATLIPNAGLTPGLILARNPKTDERTIRKRISGKTSVFN